MNYREWEESVPEMIKGDVVWKMRVYRLGMFVAEIGWPDVMKLMYTFDEDEEIMT